MTRASGFVAAACAFALGAAVAGSAGIGSAASLNLGSQKFTPYRTCVVTGTPAGSTAVLDAVVRQATAGTNFGTGTTFEVSSASGANRRAYLKFDLTGCTPSIPTTEVVRGATLRLYVSALPAVCATLDLFRVTATWTEAGITWTNQPFGTTLNNPSSASRTDSFAVGTAAGCANTVAGYASGVDVTADLAAFVAGSATNFGWMIRDDTESAAAPRTVTFSAKNLGTLAQAPQLIVTYVTTP